MLQHERERVWTEWMRMHWLKAHRACTAWALLIFALYHGIPEFLVNIGTSAVSVLIELYLGSRVRHCGLERPVEKIWLP